MGKAIVPRYGSTRPVAGMGPTFIATRFTASIRQLTTRRPRMYACGEGPATGLTGDDGREQGRY